jgi:hypothetical protein
MEKYSAIKKDEIKSFAKKWLELEIGNHCVRRDKPSSKKTACFHSYGKSRPKK